MTQCIVWIVINCLLVAFYCLCEKFSDNKSKLSFRNGIFVGIFSAYSVHWISQIFEKL